MILMKDKIIMLVIGLILGVVLAGCCFWFATKINTPTNVQEMRSGEDGRGEMRGGPDDVPSNVTDNTTNTTNSSTENDV